MAKTTISFNTPLGEMRLEQQASGLKINIDDIEAWKRVPITYTLNGNPITAEQYHVLMANWAKAEGF